MAWLCAPAVRAEFSPAEIQEAVDATFGPWNPVNGDLKGNVFNTVWSNQTAVALDAVDAARMTHPGSPYMNGGVQLFTNLTGPATLYFSFLSPEGALSVNGSAIPDSMSSFWQEGSAIVEPGDQRVTWKFAYAARVGYMDQVWTGTDPRPRILSGGLVYAHRGLTSSYQTTTNKPCDHFEATGLPPGMTIDNSTGQIQGAPAELGTFDARVKASNGAGAHTKSVVFRVHAPGPASSVDLATALDAPGLTWTQQPETFTSEFWAQDIGATVEWAGFLTSLSKDGVDAAVVALRTLPEATKASHRLGTVIQGPGVFSIWTRLITAPNGAGEAVTVPLVLAPRVNGDRINFRSTLYGFIADAQWKQWSTDIPAGRHVLELSVGYDGASTTQTRRSDSFVVFDQASFTSQPQTFTYDQWIHTVASPGSPSTDDSEGDGLPLLVEYALGGSPAFNDVALLPSVEILDGHLTMTVHKAPGVSDVEYTVQANKSLVANGWTTFGTEIMNEDANVLIVRCTKAVVQEPTCLLRLRVGLDDSVGL